MNEFLVNKWTVNNDFQLIANNFSLYFFKLRANKIIKFVKNYSY